MVACVASVLTVWQLVTGRQNSVPSLVSARNQTQQAVKSLLQICKKSHRTAYKILHTQKSSTFYVPSPLRPHCNRKHLSLLPDRVHPLWFYFPSRIFLFKYQIPPAFVMQSNSTHIFYLSKLLESTLSRSYQKNFLLNNEPVIFSKYSHHLQQHQF